jgi:hypothetical protein
MVFPKKRVKKILLDKEEDKDQLPRGYKINCRNDTAYRCYITD